MSSRLLTDTPSVVAVGVELFEQTLASQGVDVTAVDWRPPALRGEVLAGLASASTAAGTTMAAANAEAFDRLVAAEPHWVGITSARDAVGIDTGQFLHAGPPLTWERASGPMRGALIGAMIHEGMATTPDEAIAIAERGDIELAPCHSAGAVGPMAGVVSPSMPMFHVRNEAFGNDAYCTLNEGLGKVLRYGAYADEVIERLRWMQEVLGPALADAIGQREPMDLRAMIANALQMGDELHNRNRAATSLFVRELMPALLATGRATEELGEVASFINGNDHFFLNLVMPAAKSATDPCRGIEGSSMIVAMARNGTDFGIQLAGTGDEWFTAPAEVPDGLFLGSYTADDANPDIGDSTIAETSGLGGFAMAAAPAIVKFIGGEVSDALEATQSMYAITLGEHPAYQVPILDFRGTPTGIDAFRIVRTGVVPFVNTGIAGKEAGTGQVGAGLVSPPMEVFTAAIESLAGHLGVAAGDPDTAS